MVYLEAVIQGFSLKQLFYIYLGNFRGEVHFQWSCRQYVCRFSGGWAASWVFLKYFIYLLCEQLFWGNCPQQLVHNFKYTFYFNLNGRKALWRALLADGSIDIQMQIQIYIYSAKEKKALNKMQCKNKKHSDFIEIINTASNNVEYKVFRACIFFCLKLIQLVKKLVSFFRLLLIPGWFSFPPLFSS